MFACIPKLLDFSKPRAGGGQFGAQACGAAGFAVVSLPTERWCEDLRREEGESALGSGVTPNLCGDVSNLRTVAHARRVGPNDICRWESKGVENRVQRSNRNQAIIISLCASRLW